MPATIFIARLKDALRLEALWVGPDFALGRNREGDVDTLRVLGKGMGFTMHTIDPQLIGGDEVRSGRIRQHLQEGQVEIAAQLLGRPYLINGIVVDGAHRGRTIGFPTANLSVPPGRLLPANGVYATWVTLDDAPSIHLPGVTNVGVRPSFDNGHRTVETHLLDFSGDLYGCPMTLEFVAHLRPEMRFLNVDALRKQIGRDVAAARGVLGGERGVGSDEWRVESLEARLDSERMMQFYREVDHTADWAIEVWGDTLEALFEHAAAAMFELQGADMTAEPAVDAIASCQSMDLETLLVGWLNELLYLSEMNGALFTRFEIAIAEDGEPSLKATVRGPLGRGHLAHVKAVTYYQLSVKQTPEGWRATVTFDT